MKKIFTNFIWLIFFGLLIGNVWIFISGIKVSEEVNRLEKETTRLHQENIELANKINAVTSLQYTASMAAKLDFTEKPTPLVIENVPYAFKN